MAITDVFNNPANNYVNPNLSVCEGTGGGDTNLEFLANKSIGIVQGGNILQSISFANIKIPVSSYTSNRKVLEPGEVTFIQGLSKGLNYKSQFFDFPTFADPDNVLNQNFMQIDLSVSFYKNFRYSSYNISSIADNSTNISIINDLNIDLATLVAKITSSYDPSVLSFTGTQGGWDFMTSNVILSLIDASLDANSPFPSIIDSSSGNRIPQIHLLSENLTSRVLYAKYPNSAMQGIVMKITYPPVYPPFYNPPLYNPSPPLYPLTNTPVLSIYDEWIYVNHAPDIVTIYEPVQIDSSIYYQPIIKNVEVGMTGSSDSIMSAGDYLQWIDDNQDWQKVGEVYIWITPPDYDDTRNLIEGFYAFNPHDFPVQLEYITFV